MAMKHLSAAAALAVGFAGAAHADEHMIVLTGFSYFPAVTYVQPGDTVIFINESGEEQTVVGKDAGWTVGPLADNAEGSLEVTTATELKFFSAYCGSSSTTTEGCGSNAESDATSSDGSTNYGDYDNASIKAEITFDAPPLAASNQDS